MATAEILASVLVEVAGSEDMADVDHRAAFWWLAVPCQQRRVADEICQDCAY